MKMNKLTSLLFAATLGLASGAALAADTGAQSNNGQANSAADAGQVAPDARENVAPNNVDNGKINAGSTDTGGTMLHPNGSTMNHDGCRAMKSTRTQCAKMAAARIPIKRSARTRRRKPTVPPNNLRGIRPEGELRLSFFHFIHPKR
ncbi:putative homeobox protein [Klebsiella michiganensis]|uniref:Putative homeobox protein n=1 Tax=Klebsiella michiganensis TaxID=1134687 RepID=A0A7H4LX15_9ENTR|nr:putative homeobox protein [Klebsiella michiganensis]